MLQGRACVAGGQAIGAGSKSELHVQDQHLLSKTSHREAAGVHPANTGRTTSCNKTYFLHSRTGN